MSLVPASARLLISRDISFREKVRRLLLVILTVAALPFIACALALASLRRGSARAKELRLPDSSKASIVILNWNGRPLLDRCLPSVFEAIARDGREHEVIVVDNGSSDDSCAWISEHFPAVRVIELPQNIYFSGGNNIGVRVATHDIVVLLNNDMVVEPDFLGPLLDRFTSPDLFAVAAQIFLRDESKRREETGLTRGSWVNGQLQLRHDPVAGAGEAPPVLWAGGGSSAYDRRKFLALGGFDELYFPFYVEDLDLSYRAWKAGWRSVLAPESVVYHEHRGTSRPVFGDQFIDRTILRNHLLFLWRNLSSWRMLGRHLLGMPGHLLTLTLRHGAGQVTSMFFDALRRLPQVCAHRASDGRSVRGDEWLLSNPMAWMSTQVCADVNFERGDFDPQLVAGWHNSDGQDGVRFRWTAGEASMLLAAPSAKAQLVIGGWAPAFRSKAVRFAAKLDKQVVWKGKLEPGRFDLHIPVSVEPGPHVLELRTAKPYVPANHGGEDIRQLGLQVSRCAFTDN